MTRAVIFDFYGTLAEAVDWGATFEDVLAAHGLGLPQDGASSHFDRHDGHEHLAHSQSRDHYVAWEQERLRAYAVAAGAEGPTTASLVDDLYAASKTFRLRVYDDVAEVVDELRRRDCRLAVCSNWDWDLPELLERLELGNAFDVVVTSARAGARKPHPLIYDHTLTALALEARDALFVGDSPGPDVEGPVAHGMRAVLLRRPGAPEVVVPEGAPIVHGLEALFGLV